MSNDNGNYNGNDNYSIRTIIMVAFININNGVREGKVNYILLTIINPIL